jgi:hypothetical protein
MMIKQWSKIKQRSKKLNPRLLKVLLISFGIHGVAILVLGGITIYNLTTPEKAQFEEPPTVEKEEPPPARVKIEVSPKAVPEEMANQRVKMKPLSQISVKPLDFDLPELQDSFTVNAGTGGFSGGSVLGGARGSLGMGRSNVNVFGLKSSSERLLFVIDAGSDMLIDAKGGLSSFNIIKDEIAGLVGNLTGGTLFNVMLVDRHNYVLFRPQLVPAGQKIHEQLVEWLRPINRDGNNLGLGGVEGTAQIELSALTEHPVNTDLNMRGAEGNETALHTQIALEQSVDAIFFITGYHRGFEAIRRTPTVSEEKEWERTTSAPGYVRQHREHYREVPLMRQQVRERLAEINEERAKRGEPPRVVDQRDGIYSSAKDLELEWKVEHPGFKPAYYHEPGQVENYFNELVELLYVNRGGDRPSFNVVLFLAGDEDLRKEWENGLKDYVRFFDGDYRVIRGKDGIMRASTVQTSGEPE